MSKEEEESNINVIEDIFDPIADVSDRENEEEEVSTMKEKEGDDSTLYKEVLGKRLLTKHRTEVGLDDYKLPSKLRSKGKGVSLDLLLAKSADAKGAGKLRKQIASQKRSKRQTTVHAPLPSVERRQILEQEVFGAVKDDLTKWQPMVTQQRRAEHVSFPLATAERPNEESLSSLFLYGHSKDAPSGTLAGDIGRAVAEAMDPSVTTDEIREGVIESRRAEEEDLDDDGFEEGGGPSLTKEAHAHYSKLRSQMFLRNIEARRTKKIKSKKYRRMVRKEKRKAADGADASEMQSLLERERARERITLRHSNRSSSNKLSWKGKKANQLERERVAEADLIRRKILAAPMGGDRNEDEASVEASEASEDEATGERDEVEEIRELKRMVEEEREESEKTKTTGVDALKFMKRAEEKKRLEILESLDIAENEAISRKEKNMSKNTHSDDPMNIVAASLKMSRVEQKTSTIGRKYKADVSLDDVESAIDIVEGLKEKKDELDEVLITKEGRNREDRAGADENEANPFLSRSTFRKSKLKGSEDIFSLKNTSTDTTDSHFASDMPVEGNSLAPANDKNEVEADLDNEEGQRLILEEFNEASGIAEEFAKTKDEESAESAKAEVPVLEGWGSWAGKGIEYKTPKSVREKNRAIREENRKRKRQRKDFGMDRVIINEKRNRKAVKYKLDHIPHPFTNAEQIASTMSRPLGKEWNTRNAYGELVQPKVTVKKGVPIAPMSFRNTVEVKKKK